MNKFFMVIFAILLVGTFVVAQNNTNNNTTNNNTTNTAPPAPSTSDRVMESVNAFINTAGSNLDNPDAYRSQMKSIADNINAEQLSQVQNYFSQEQSKITEVVNLVNGYQNKGEALRNYFSEVASFNKEFLIDKRDDPNRFSVENYIADLNTLKGNTTSYLQSINSNSNSNNSNAATNNNNSSINADGMRTRILASLDKGVQTIEQKGIKFEVIRTGLDNRYSAHNIHQIVNKFRSAFGGNSTLSSALDFFMNIWPQATENLVMDNQYPNDLYTRFKDGSGTLGEVTGHTFAYDETGQLTNTNPGSDSAYSSEVLSTATNTVIDQRFNARSFGGTNGNYTTIRITTGGQTFELQDQIFTSPIVLDMDGDGKLEASGGKWLPHTYANCKLVEFDLTGDGFIELVEWVGPNDGLLLVYNKGEEVSGNNLFGEAGGFYHGFEKLSLYDANADGQISGDELNVLSIWQDKNTNGKVDASEVTSVVERGISSLSLDQTDSVASFVQNGEKKTMWDWYPAIFRVKRTR